MPAYKLYLESGPKRRTTMVHVLDLLGCVANGKTTDEALAATPGAISAYRAFLRRHGEAIDTTVPITTEVVQHVTEGEWLGNGSPYIVFPPDLKPVTPAEIDRFLGRFEAIYGELAAWARTQSAARLDAAPRAGGRTGRAVLHHALDTPGAYLSAALGGAKGFSRIAGAAGRGELPLPDAYAAMVTLAVDLVRGTTREQRAAVRSLTDGARVYTLRKAIRRMLEHGWEHLSELARRPGGPGLAS